MCRCCPRHSAAGEQELKRTVHALFKRLRGNHLEALLKAIETQGGDPGECVTVPLQSEGGRQSVPPYLLLCRLYRWGDLQPSAQLKVLCHCQGSRAADSAAQVCCNPYHYSRLCGPGKHRDTHAQQP